QVSYRNLCDRSIAVRVNIGTYQIHRSVSRTCNVSWHDCCSVSRRLIAGGISDMSQRNTRASRTAVMLVPVLAALCAPQSPILAAPIDPGVRHAATDGGPAIPLPGLTADEQAFFQNGLNRFQNVEAVRGAINNGLGPRFNADQCSSCHAYPFVGGSSPASNPQIAVATADGATNTIPWFVVSNGPVREARFIQSNGAPDGGVHDLFVITGRT